jgi:hypothetical protein
MAFDFFTIIKTYLHCCCESDTPKSPYGESRCGGIYQQDDGEDHQFSFDDTSSRYESGSFSTCSSSSTLDGYDEHRNHHFKRQIHRIKKYQHNLFHPYEEDNSD